MSSITNMKAGTRRIGRVYTRTLGRERSARGSSSRRRRFRLTRASTRLGSKPICISESAGWCSSQKASCIPTSIRRLVGVPPSARSVWPVPRRRCPLGRSVHQALQSASVRADIRNSLSDPRGPSRPARPCDSAQVARPPPEASTTLMRGMRNVDWTHCSRAPRLVHRLEDNL